MADEILTQRDLNRILLARQMLLAREEIGPVEALERLFAIQAQLPRAPFLACGPGWRTSTAKTFSRRSMRARSSAPP